MLYILEDDGDIRRLERYALENSGFSVAEFADSGAFWKAVRAETPELILLDVMLPGEDGLAVLRRLRAADATRSVPIMMVTAKTTEIDRVMGLDLGADDYLVKPFGVMELLSRVKALLRRAGGQPETDALCYGGIRLDPSRHTVTADGKPVELTYKEFALLHDLMVNRDLALTREQIMDRVWGVDYEGESRTVDMHIMTLRQKLGGCGRLIRTVRNVGYKLEAD